VVPLTEQLYAVARETNALEHENFRLVQEQAVKAELKAVLDSWVRHEQQQREAEQAALVQSIQANIQAEFEKPAFRKQLLEEAISQVERESENPKLRTLLTRRRDLQVQADLSGEEKSRRKKAGAVEVEHT
jgi:F-type H+-transporting ATPase subunit b